VAAGIDGLTTSRETAAERRRSSRNLGAPTPWRLPEPPRSARAGGGFWRLLWGGKRLEIVLAWCDNEHHLADSVGALLAGAVLAVAIGFLDHNLKASGGGSSWVSLLPARVERFGASSDPT